MMKFNLQKPKVYSFLNQLFVSKIPFAQALQCPSYFSYEKLGAFTSIDSKSQYIITYQLARYIKPEQNSGLLRTWVMPIQLMDFNHKTIGK